MITPGAVRPVALARIVEYPILAGRGMPCSDLPSPPCCWLPGVHPPRPQDRSLWRVGSRTAPWR
jgi:hypothetical protein